jgi:hypothetical protein
MGKIDTSGWKEFRIKDLFETQKKGNKLQVPTGASVPVQDLLEDGATPRITVTGSNNGIFGFYDYCGKNIADYRVFNNFVSVSFLETVFYQEGDATLDMKVHCLKPKGITLNKYTGRFLVGAIRASLRESTYSDQISSSILPEMSIKLPATPDGAPDWAYMESYMASLETKVADSLTLLQAAKDAEKKKVDTREWREFRVGELFDIKRPAARSKKKYCEGEINYVSSGAFNNGVANKLMPLPNELLDRGGCITVSPLDGSSFYQEEDFLGRGGSGASILILYNSHLNRNNALFICSVIRSSANGFGYTDLLNGENLKSLTIKLPMDKTGQPDWAYMEEYMRKVEEKAKNVLNYFEKDRNGV